MPFAVKLLPPHHVSYVYLTENGGIGRKSEAQRFGEERVANLIRDLLISDGMKARTVRMEDGR